MSEALEIFTVYQFGPNYAVRRFVIEPGSDPIGDPNLCAVGRDLDAIRKQISPGRVPIARHAEDAPNVVECWI